MKLTERNQGKSNRNGKSRLSEIAILKKSNRLENQRFEKTRSLLRRRSVESGRSPASSPNGIVAIGTLLALATGSIDESLDVTGVPWFLEFENREEFKI